MQVDRVLTGIISVEQDEELKRSRDAVRRRRNPLEDERECQEVVVSMASAQVSTPGPVDVLMPVAPPVVRARVEGERGRLLHHPTEMPATSAELLPWPPARRDRQVTGTCHDRALHHQRPFDNANAGSFDWNSSHASGHRPT